MRYFLDVYSHWKDAVAFHGHACPGLALGCRMALAAAEALHIKQRDNDEESLCIAETDACCVDAVQSIWGCTLGKGNLFLKMRGKTALTFMDRTSEAAVRVQWIATFMPQLSREQRQTYFLEAPAKEVLRIDAVPFAPPSRALISPSLECSVCYEQVAEPYARLHHGTTLCLDCYQNHSRIL